MDPEEEFHAEEISKLKEDVEEKGLSVVLLAGKYVGHKINFVQIKSTYLCWENAGPRVTKFCSCH